MTEREVAEIAAGAVEPLVQLAGDMGIPEDEFWAALNVAWIDRVRGLDDAA